MYQSIIALSNRNMHIKACEIELSCCVSIFSPVFRYLILLLQVSDHLQLAKDCVVFGYTSTPCVDFFYFAWHGHQVEGTNMF